MELTRFSRLPPEINLYLLETTPSSDLYNLCQLEPFVHLCDWSFWRRRCREDFQVPFDYFDLAVYRNISGAYRYLEISGRFNLNIESLVSVSERVVYGIYDLNALFTKAIDKGDDQLVERLLPSVSPDFINNHLGLRDYLTKSFWFENLGRIKVIETLGRSLGFQSIYQIYPELPPIILQVENYQWDEVDQELSLLVTMAPHFREFGSQLPPVREIIFGTLADLIQTQQDSAFHLVQKYFNNVDSTLQDALLHCCLQCGNEIQTDWIMSKITLTPPSSVNDINFSSYFGRIANLRFDIPTGIRFNYLYSAYYGGNLRLVEKFEVLGYLNLEFDQNKINSEIKRGYIDGFSNPVSVYQLLLNRPELFSISGEVILDLDIANLAKEYKSMERS